MRRRPDARAGRARTAQARVRRGRSRTNDDGAGEYKPFGHIVDRSRSAIVVHAPGCAPAVFEEMSGTFYDLKTPSEVSAGAQVVVGGREILRPSRSGGAWVWCTGDRAGPGRRDPRLRDLFVRFADSVRELLRAGVVDRQGLLDAEIRDVADDSRTILRLPPRAGSTDPRFREMWVFAPGSAARPIEDDLVDAEPYGRLPLADGAFVFCEDGARARCGLIDPRDYRLPPNVHVDASLREAMLAHPSAFENLWMQPRPPPLAEVFEARVVLGSFDATGERPIVLVSPDGRVLGVTSDSGWPKLRTFMRWNKVVVLDHGLRLEATPEGNAFAYRLFDPETDFARLRREVNTTLGSDWFERRNIPTIVRSSKR